MCRQAPAHTRRLDFGANLDNGRLVGGGSRFRLVGGGSLFRLVGGGSLFRLSGGGSLFRLGGGRSLGFGAHSALGFGAFSIFLVERTITVICPLVRCGTTFALATLNVHARERKRDVGMKEELRLILTGVCVSECMG